MADSISPKISIATTIIALASIANCQLFRQSLKSDRRYANDSPLDLDITLYARECRQELGFEGIPIPPLNCLEGAEVPLTIGGKTPSEEEYQKLAKGEIGCDQPSWLGGVGCANYNFVLHKTISDNVDLALICRNRGFSSVFTRTDRIAAFANDPTDTNFKNLYYFDSLGMIVTNKVSGKTCFFDQVKNTYGGWVPFPDDNHSPAVADLPIPRPTEQNLANESINRQTLQTHGATIWKSPIEVALGDRCTFCHDGGVWKTTPWLPAAAHIPSNVRDIPIIPIGYAFETWRQQNPSMSINTADITQQNGEKERQLCTSCHRIGSEATCLDMISWASGLSKPAMLSSIGELPHNRRWMPPQDDAAKKLSEDDFAKNWDQRALKHVNALLCCCKTPNAKGCVKEFFGVNGLFSTSAEANADTPCVP